MDRDSILAEVRRTAVENGGVALGRLRLETEAGVKAHHWKKYWARYGDLVREAGFEPNKLVDAIPDDELCAAVVVLARELGRFPTLADLQVRRAYDAAFPSVGVFQRLGNKAAIVTKVVAYCRARDGHEDVPAMCPDATHKRPSKSPQTDTTGDGFVYLIESGRFYKIGHSVHAGARERQLAIQLPEPVATVHVIRTDDPTGIEAYWHRRFADLRKNGEWFDLRREDVAAFKRRKFM